MTSREVACAQPALLPEELPWVHLRLEGAEELRDVVPHTSLSLGTPGDPLHHWF